MTSVPSIVLVSKQNQRSFFFKTQSPKKYSQTRHYDGSVDLNHNSVSSIQGGDWGMIKFSEMPRQVEQVQKILD